MEHEITERVEHVISSALREARLLGDELLGAIHLLLGILADGKSATAQALEAMELTHSRVALALDEILSSPNRMPLQDGQHITMGPSAEAALNRASVEVSHRGDERIATAHVFLGIVADNDDLAVRVIQHLGLDVDDLCEYVATLPPRNADISRQLTSIDSRESLQRGSLDYLRPRGRPILGTAKEAAQMGCNGWDHALYAVRDHRGLDPEDLSVVAGSIVGTINLIHSIAGLLPNMDAEKESDQPSAERAAAQASELVQLRHSLKQAYVHADKYWSAVNRATPGTNVEN